MTRGLMPVCASCCINGSNFVKLYCPCVCSTSAQEISSRAQLTPSVATCGGCPVVGGKCEATPKGVSAGVTLLAIFLLRAACAILGCQKIRKTAILEISRHRLIKRTRPTLLFSSMNKRPFIQMSCHPVESTFALGSYRICSSKEDGTS